MLLEETIEVLEELGRYMRSSTDSLTQAKLLAKATNPWFTAASMDTALTQMSTSYLDADVLGKVAETYQVEARPANRRVGLVLAGNIPLVGLHDIICVLVAGHKAKVKYSSKDSLLKHLMDYLLDLKPRLAEYLVAVERLKDIDAVIATGSNNSAGYFDTYFGRYTNIIRRNRSALAVLHGNEGEKEFLALGQDIFTYFGLGCRNVSHICIPQGYDFMPLLDHVHEGYKEVVLHNKYKNNYDFQYSTMLMNKVDFRMTGSLLLRESMQIASPIAVVHYHTYATMEELCDWVDEKRAEIQCIVSAEKVGEERVHNLGHAQAPGFTNYADGVDTMQFLVNLGR